MAFKLEKDQKFNLTKEEPTLKVVRAELGWSTDKNTFPKFDLDVSLFGLKQTATGPKLVADDYFIFYNHANKDPKDNTKPIVTDDGAIVKSPDELEGGVEWIKIDLSKVRSDTTELSFVVTIHEAMKRRQTFNYVSDAYIKLFNDETNEEICVYDLDEEFGQETAVQIGSLIRSEDEWVFESVGVGYTLSLLDFVNGYTS